MQSYKMEVSKKEDKAYVKVGEVEVFYPLLSELGLTVEPTGKDEEGFPTYADEKVQYVFDAVLAAVKATARNRLVSGTATLKPDNTIADTIEALLATGERSGEALKQRREYFNSFKAWLPSTGKSAAWCLGMFDIITNVKNIPYQSPTRKATVKDLVAQHAATLDAESVAKWERVMTQIDENCTAADPLDS
jgi:hypothetical protein